MTTTCDPKLVARCAALLRGLCHDDMAEMVEGMARELELPRDWDTEGQVPIEGGAGVTSVWRAWAEDANTVRVEGPMGDPGEVKVEVQKPHCQPQAHIFQLGRDACLCGSAHFGQPSNTETIRLGPREG